MSWIWTIPIKIRASQLLRPPLLCLEHTRAIIPTFQDWDAARTTIDSILACRARPAEIVLVNDNIESNRPTWVDRYPIIVVDYPGNCGPSFARNMGARARTVTPIDWLYFTDTGCGRDTAFFSELVEASMTMPRTTVAVAAPVVGTAESGIDSPINRYMTEEAILNPPRDDQGPQAIVTANAIVSAAAFHAIGGFDTSYPFAAGEDLDLGVRLRRFGPIGWAERAAVNHHFIESEEDFRRRFTRYGAGTAHLERTLAGC
ncbi:MAG: glycosyltransferase family 2 protein [Phycisphaeraceae bacterium]|nr:glycosyltransferase family 2 protein [Phycisphaeraceae bacterium]